MIVVLGGAFLLLIGVLIMSAAAAPGSASAAPQLTPTPTCVPPVWTQKAAFPSRESEVSLVSDGTYVYANGGWDNNIHHAETYRYDPATDAWTQLAPSLDAHSDSPAVYSPDDQRIYVFGGYTGSGIVATVRIYDIASNIWTTSPAPMPQPRAQMAAGYYQGKIVIAGGSNNSGDQMDTWSYDIATASWTTLPAMLVPVSQAAYGVINNQFYVAGGRRDKASLYALDLTTHAWRQLADMPQGRTWPGGAVLNGRLWVYGGARCCTSYYNTTFIYNPATNSWTTGQTMNVAHAYLYGVSIGTSVIAVGGYNGNGYMNNTDLSDEGTTCPPPPTPQPTTTPPPLCGLSTWVQTAGFPARENVISLASDGTYVYANGGGDNNTRHNETYRYDPSDDSWSQLTPSPDQHSDSPAVYDENGKIYVLGGYTSSGIVATVRVYDIAANSWATVTPMPAPRAQMAAGYYQGKIYVAGGRNSSGDQPDTWSYDIATNSWTTLPAMLVPVSQAAYGVINNQFYVAGGGGDKATLYALDLTTHAWRQLANMPQGRTWPGGAVLNGRLWVFGGARCCTSYYNTTFIYNPPTDTWVTGQPMNVAYSYVYGTTLGTSVMVVGGYNGNGFIPNTERATEGFTCPPSPTPTRTPVTTPTACAITFNDVPIGNTFYTSIRCLACRGIIGGYPCGGPGEPCPGTYFRPNNNVTRGQVSKIVSESAAFGDTIPSTQQTFQDVPYNNPFWLWVERLSGRGIIGGYPCGGPFEPCITPANRPYFRPNNNVTRGQLSKITSGAAGWTETPTAQTFEDVLPGSTFYLYIERASSRAVIGGYPCGGAGEPCIAPGNRPYFRPNNNATRGQMSKIAAQAFYPNCQTPAKR
jgi:N-acetylneuraminic acid mutarotase